MVVRVVKNDSIVGMKNKTRIAFAKKYIREIRQTKGGATFAIVGGAAVAIGISLLMIEEAEKVGDLLSSSPQSN